MFRNPRENGSPSNTTLLKPSTGRAPTPPNESRTARSAQVANFAMGSKGSNKPLTPRPTSKINAFSSSATKAGTKKTAGSGVGMGKTPVKGKGNTSILSFFKKVDNPLLEDEIFVPKRGADKLALLSRRSGSPDLGEGEEFVDLYGDGDDVNSGLGGIAVDAADSRDAARYNEAGGSVKRRRIEGEGNGEEQDRGVGEVKTGSANASGGEPKLSGPAKKPKAKKPKRRGPFLSDSDTDDDYLEAFPVRTNGVEAVKPELCSAVVNEPDIKSEYIEIDSLGRNVEHENKSILPKEDATPEANMSSTTRTRVPVTKAQAKWEPLQPSRSGTDDDKSDSDGDTRGTTLVKKDFLVPALMKEETSVDEWGDFGDLEDLGDLDEFADGEEFVERRFMEEQARLEAAELCGEFGSMNGFEDLPEPPNEQETSRCPMCDASLKGVSADLATRHVNGCLDGNPVPLPVFKKEPTEVKLMPPEAKNRFAQKAAIARPGQANPFDLSSASTAPSSAFSKLMSGKAEDAAWAAASASEQTSRGKPAYQRTCPFYKIMPGFNICVDAFRYGAVQGCKAYFLSHFHSDHYIGLTSSWCHGPIYCSKVTANLVKQRLRVDPQWVVALEFEEPFEVPGSNGVTVTMIPANHCPGSSLFLYEKVIGKGPNPKMQRVLHCGDFRACPAHIAHPLLMPDLVDSITGKTKQQKIDVCYLDTTYLNPRYAFPSQEEVIKACADMCVSLKKERAEESDAWEVVKRERAGTGMTKFVNSAIKPTDDSLAMSLTTTTSKPRGRLLVICGTYSIGKERICLGIARALDCKIYAPPGKMRIVRALEDEELWSRMTDDPKEAQIHMQMLMEIRAETLQEYLNGYKPHFSRIVGFRPSGWNYRPPNSRFTDSPSISTILHSLNWRSSYGMAELVPQRGSTKEASCFGVPYSEHSSFRELTMFVCALRIEKVVPTVNVGSAASRAKMKSWIERWMAERRKNGVVRVGEGEGMVRW